MAGFLQRLARSMGDAVGEFTKARDTALFGSSRGEWLTSYADEMGRRGKGHDERAQLRALQNSWYFSGITMIAGEVAAATLKIMRKGMAGKPAKPLPKHQFLEVFTNPNPWMDDDFLMRFTALWLKLDGNAFWYLIFDENEVLQEIWPLPSDKVVAVPGNKDDFVTYYEYTAGGRRYQIPENNIAHFINIPNPYNVFDGLSELVAGILPIDADSAMARWNAKFFGRDNVMPSAIINLRSGDPRKRVANSDILAIKEDMSADYAAFNRKTLVTGAPGGIDVHALGWSMRDLDFVLGREKTRKEIYELLGIPEGVYDKNTTEASANVAVRIFKDNVWSRVLTPLAKRITQRILHIHYGEQYYAAYDDIRPVDREMVIKERMQNWKARTLDEARMELGDEPYSGPYAELLGKLPVELATNPQAAAEFIKIQMGVYQKPEAEPEQRPGDDDADENEDESRPTASRPISTKELEDAAERSSSKAITVHPGNYTGGMLGWFVPAHISNKLAHPDDRFPDGSHIVPFSDRHITFCYWKPEGAPSYSDLAPIVANYAAQHKSIDIRITGRIGRFDGVEDGLFDVVYYEIESEQLHAFRDGLLKALVAKFPDLNSPDLERSWVPHISIAYVPRTAGVRLSPEPLTATMDSVTCAQSGARLGMFDLVSPEALRDLGLWQEKIIRKGKNVVFATSAIPVWLQDEVRINLSALGSTPEPAEIKQVFSPWL